MSEAKFSANDGVRLILEAMAHDVENPRLWSDIGRRLRRALREPSSERALAFTLLDFVGHVAQWTSEPADPYRIEFLLNGELDYLLRLRLPTMLAADAITSALPPIIDFARLAANHAYQTQCQYIAQPELTLQHPLLEPKTLAEGTPPALEQLGLQGIEVPPPENRLQNANHALNALIALLLREHCPSGPGTMPENLEAEAMGAIDSAVAHLEGEPELKRAFLQTTMQMLQHRPLPEAVSVLQAVSDTLASLRRAPSAQDLRQALVQAGAEPNVIQRLEAEVARGSASSSMSHSGMASSSRLAPVS